MKGLVVHCAPPLVITHNKNCYPSLSLTGDSGQSPGVELSVRKQKIAFIAALALPMQIFIRKASDSIVTVLLALQWLSVHPCYQEIG